MASLAEVIAPLTEISRGPKYSNRAIIKFTDGQIKAYHITITMLVETVTISYEDKTSDSFHGHVGKSRGCSNGKGKEKWRKATLCVFSKDAPTIQAGTLHFL